MPSFAWVDSVLEYSRGGISRVKRFFSRHIRHSFFVFGLLSISWLIFRSGTKPSRITYPCQQAAATAGTLWYLTYITPILAIVALKKRYIPGIKGIGIIFAICILSLSTAVLVLHSPASPAEVIPGAGYGLDVSDPVDELLSSQKSQIFVLNGRSDPGGVQDLIEEMGKNNFLFYQSSATGENKGPSGIIGADDVVLIKVNCQWDERGGTNTDVVKGLIQAIVNHPDGFTGEIVVVDNGQGRGSFTWANANAADHAQSIQKVVNSFSGQYRVSTCLWDNISYSEVMEYDQGNSNDGYIVNHTPNPRTGIHVSYPKFRTRYGTNVSLKKGIWKNGTYDNTNLKLINVPVLKTHSYAGVTSCIKHYVGVLSVSKTDGLAPVAHGWIFTGGLGTEMIESRFPDLNIVDATWVNPVPTGYPGAGPGTSYQVGTYQNTLLAGTDPVALDYYCAKYILMPVASGRGYTDLASINPDVTSTNSFGRWLRLSRDEIIRGGHLATVNESQMEVISAYIPSVENIIPDTGLSGSSVQITGLSGSNFQPGIPDEGVYLTKNGQANITATDVNVIDSTRITFVLNLPSGPGMAGQWNVVVTNPGGYTAILTNGFTITVPETKIGIYKDGNWYLDYNGDGAFIPATGDRYIPYGGNNWTRIVGDWNGDGKSEIGIYSNGSWYLDYGGSGVIDADTRYGAFGAEGWAPVTGDWNADGRDEIGVYQDGNWYLDYDGNCMWGSEDRGYGFGAPGWVPITGKWKGDNRTRIGVYSDGNWYLDLNGNGEFDTGEYIPYGTDGWTGITGDWNGDGYTEIGIYRDGFWYLDSGGNGVIDSDTTYCAFGAPGFYPITGDWNGDGLDSVGVYQNGNWYLDYDGNSCWSPDDRSYAFGAAGWIPVFGIWI